MQAKPATKEFVEWLRKNIGELIPMTRKIVTTGEQHVPALFVFPVDPEISVQIIPMAPFFDHEREGGKDFAAMIHQQIGEDSEVECAVLVTEAYLIAAKIDNPKVREIDMKQTIENHPMRQEAVVFNAVNHGMQLIATFIIKRPDNTIADTWDHLLDPRVGILEGEGAGEGVSAAVGRMVVDDRNIH